MQTFEERQRAWQGQLREFRQTRGRSAKTRVWQIKVEGARVFVKYGQLDGAMQETSYLGKAKNKGKANYISAETDALAEARRDCRMKYDFEGHDEYVNGVNVDNRFSGTISIPDLLRDLPGCFCLYKPENSLENDCPALYKRALIGDPSVVYTIKRNGEMFMAIIKEDGSVEFRSRRGRKWADCEGPIELPDGNLDESQVVPLTNRFSYLVPQIQSLGLPPNTVLAGELCMWTEHGDDHAYVSGLTKSKTDYALNKMAECGYPSFYIWDVPFYGGMDWVTEVTPRFRFAALRGLMESGHHPNLEMVSYYTFPTPAAAIDYAKQYKLEGFVVIDLDSKYGDKGWNLTGKPYRPVTCGKLKPEFEDDFVALFDPDNKVGKWGIGKHEKGKTVTLPSGEQVVHGGVGSVMLYQYNSWGVLVPICKCSGMEYEMQAKLRPEDFPMVWEVTYTDRRYISDGDDTDALDFPRFSRLRTDKSAKECVNPKLDR